MNVGSTPIASSRNRRLVAHSRRHDDTHEVGSFGTLAAGDTVTVDFHLQMPELYPSHFSFSPAIADGTLVHYKMCDWIDNALVLQMGHCGGQVYGYLHLPCRVEVNARLALPEKELRRG